MPQDEPLVSDTSPLRYFALVRRLDQLIEIAGGRVLAPREVLDPDEDPDGIAFSLSEIGQSERYWAKRSRDPDGMDNWNRLRGIRRLVDRGIEVVDLTDEEIVSVAQIAGRATQRRYGLDAPLGPGEAAVVAIVGSRGGVAALDEDAARRVLADRAPGTRALTCRDLLNLGVERSILPLEEAEAVYQDMIAKGYRGPPSLRY